MLWSGLLLLVGCLGLSGTWQGELLCLGSEDTLDGEAALTLHGDRGGEFDGELRAEGERASATGRQEMVLAWELELEKTAPAGRQDLLALVDDCLLYVDGALADERCPAVEAGWTWDGGDTLWLEGEDCSLSLVR